MLALRRDGIESAHVSTIYKLTIEFTSWTGHSR